MTHATAVWIDQNVAKLFRIPADRTHWTGEPGDCQVFHGHLVDHHTHRLDHIDQARKSRPLYETLISHLSVNDDLVIFGPGLARFHFENFLKEHHPLLAKRVVACEAIDHVTDGQVAARARRILDKKAAAATQTVMA